MMATACFQDTMWQQLWREAPAMPAAMQRPLFDPFREGELALDWWAFCVGAPGSHARNLPIVLGAQQARQQVCPGVLCFAHQLPTLQGGSQCSG